LLGNLLATCSHVEYADEPYTGMLLPMAAHSGKVDRQFAVDWLSTYFGELFHDLVLLRRANFRPHDLSSIWSKKPPAEIFERLNGLRSRDEVSRHVASHGTSLLVTLSESAPFLDIVSEALPAAKIVHVVRDGFEVAAAVLEKGWFADAALRRPTIAQLFTPVERHDGLWHVPWWVDAGDEQAFIEMAEADRCAYYWCSLMEKGRGRLRAGAGLEGLVVRYESLVRNPRQEFHRAASFLNARPGPLTEVRLGEIVERADRSLVDRISPGLRARVRSLNKAVEAESQ
jgi:hypothetical protein